MARPDFLKKIRDQELTLARRLAEEVSPMVEVLALKLVPEAGRVDIDEETFRACAGSEVVVQMLRAVKGYVAWIGSQVVRSGSYGPMRLAAPPPEALAAIAEKYDVEQAVLAYAIGRMMTTPGQLPLVGYAVGGMLFPAVKTLKKWKALYDWSGLAKPQP